MFKPPFCLISLIRRGSLLSQIIKSAPHSILSGIALMQDYEIIVDRNSHGIVRELNNYAWQEKNAKPNVGYEHYLDAIRYGLTYLVQNKNSGRYIIR